MANQWEAFWRALATQGRVLHALLMREVMTRYGRHNIGFLWLFIEPMLFTLGITLMWSMVHGGTHGSSFHASIFAVTGYSCVLLWRNGSSRCVAAVEPNLSLLYHRNVRVIDVFLARLLLEICGGTCSFVVLTCVLVFIGQTGWPDDLGLVLQGWFLIAWFTIALGLTIGALSEYSEIIERVWHVITYLLFPMSGALFMVDWLPQKMQHAVLFIPMVHATEMIRHGFFGDSVTTYEQPIYLVIYNFVLTFIGLLFTREAGRKVLPQ